MSNFHFRESSRRSAAILAAPILAFFLQIAAASADSILFIGHSFTHGDGSPVKFFHPETVSDLNGTALGGMPALFKSFTAQAGLKFDVSLETAPGQGIDYHFAHKTNLIAKPWDHVVMQAYSILDAAKPGDPALLIKSAGQMAEFLHALNPAMDVRLMSTWSRADQTYQPSGHWYGKPIDAMEKDVRAANDQAATACSFIKGVIPVGQVWNRAIETGFADANPYDGIDANKVDLWTYDHYHGSTYGYYLEALTVFGAITGMDPRSLGNRERAAYELGISTAQAAKMQQIAYDELVANGFKDMKTFTPVRPAVR